MLQGSARIKFEAGGLRAKTNADILSYYLWLFRKDSYNVFPMFTVRSAHISIVLPHFNKIPAKELLKYDNILVDFFYDPAKIYVGGRKKGFTGFYLPVVSKQIGEIREKLGIKPNFNNDLHLSLFSNKHLVKK